jgi:hypothetical protein
MHYIFTEKQKIVFLQRSPGSANSSTGYVLVGGEVENGEIKKVEWRKVHFLSMEQKKKSSSDCVIAQF